MPNSGKINSPCIKTAYQLITFDYVRMHVSSVQESSGQEPHNMLEILFSRVLPPSFFLDFYNSIYTWPYPKIPSLRLHNAQTSLNM
jgi:hypothetical protein